MEPNDQQELPDYFQSLRSKAEIFFDASFSDVQISVDPDSRLADAVAYTFGNKIFFNPEVFKLRKHNIYELLIHELTHVVQQSQGRVLPNTVWAGRLGNDNSELETEAWKMSRSASFGGRSSLRYAGSGSMAPPVIQKAVLLGGKLIKTKDNLTVKANKVLELITDGETWLNWAIAGQDSVFPFPDEPELLKGIQTGNHGENVILLKKSKLFIAPIKLMELEEADLNQLSCYENKGAGSVSPELEKSIFDIFTKYGIADQNQLAQTDAMLEGFGSKNDPLFQTLDLSETIALLDLYKGFGQTEDKIKINAAAFALDQAPTPLAFSDYVLFYLSMVKKLAISEDEIAETVSGKVENILKSFKPFLFNMLRCPRVDKTLTIDQIAQTLQNWIGKQNIVGFSRISSGALQVALNINVDNPEHFEKSIKSYMDKAQNFIQNNKPQTQNTSQDGQTVFYSYKSWDAEAVLALNQSGNITLKSYTIKS